MGMVNALGNDQDKVIRCASTSDPEEKTGMINLRSPGCIGRSGDRREEGG
jgi:hypothetical protein